MLGVGCVNIIVDTREKVDKNLHVTNHFDKQDIKWYRSKLICGDYQNPLNPTVVIDRKQSLQEVCGNVTKDHARFVRELELAKDLGYKMIVLVEEPNINSLSQVPTWYNWRRKTNPKAINGRTLYKIMLTMSQKYNFEWQFTTKSKCGEKIVELLS
jgi:ERCC4-type nuclease